MLQVVIPGQRIGHQFKAGENMVMGTVAYISGMHTDGYYLLKNPRTATTAAVSIYPFLKYSYREDLSDYGVTTAGEGELIASGESVVAFEGGEYITDRYLSGITSGGGAIGTHTTSQWFMDNIALDSASVPRSLIVTDTAAYTEGNGAIVYLFPCTAAANKGYLRISTAADSLTVGAAGQFMARYNRNFQLVRTWNRGKLGFGGNVVQFRVIGRDAFSGRFWSGVSTAAYFNVSIVNQ